MKIDIDTPFQNCDKCKRLQLEEHVVYENNEVASRTYTCRHGEECENAVKIATMDK